MDDLHRALAERLPELEAQVNAAIQAHLPQRLWRKPRDIAIDLHEQPYYGRTEQETGLWVRSQPKASTSRFYRVATAYVMNRNLRVTLAVVYMPPSVSVGSALQTLLAHITRLGLPVSCLWLDKGFASVELIGYLQDANYAAVIACPQRGKRDGQGTRSLCRGRGSYVTEHTFTSHDHRQKRTVAVAVCHCFTRTLPRRLQWQLFIMISVSLKPQQVLARYTHRFGIETSYRCANQVRGRTTSPNAAYRFLLLGLAFYLYNVWVNLVWLSTQVPRRGGRYLDVARFRLERFKDFVRHALESYYGIVTEITLPAAPRL